MQTTSADRARPSNDPRALDLQAGAGVATVVLLLYVLTLAPSLTFPVMDGHELTLNALRLGVAHPSGYPIYTWLGHLFIQVLPVGDPAYRMNLMSAVGGATAVGLLVALGRALGLDVVCALFAALLLGLSTTFWSQAVMAEVYAPDKAMLVLTLLLLVRWAAQVRAGNDGTRRFVAFAFVFGLSLGTHLSNLGFAPTFALFAIATDPAIVRRPRAWLPALAAFLLGAAQYVWLPLRGGTFDQYPNPQPVTLEAVYDYTLGAFAPLKFAYPVAALPGRLSLYLALVVKNFTAGGVALGSLGMWLVLRRSPDRFWLLFGVLGTNAFVFAQMAVPDPAPFFLAGYLSWVLFIAFGVQGLVALARIPTALAAVALAASLVVLGARSWRENDRSDDTLVGDFVPNAFAMMPPGSFVVGARGAFGADLLYWQSLGTGADVVVLGQTGAPPHTFGAPLFTTVRTANGVPTPVGWEGQAWTLPADAWYVPVLFGNARALTLCRVQRTLPDVIVTAAPAERIDRRVGPLMLVAAIVSVQSGATTPRLQIESWWRIPAVERFVVSTLMDDETLESHDLGLGNLLRYAAEVGVPEGAMVRERYAVVLPSTRAAGPHVIRLGVTQQTPRGLTTHSTEVARVAVE